MAKGKKHQKDKFYYFIENWSIFIILLAFILYSLIIYFFDINQTFQYFIEVTLREALYSLKSSLLSIAAIFIGIYVTVFTLLGSIKVDSIFAFLNEYTFKKLIKFIRNAFIASFLYIILIMVLEVSYNHYYQVAFQWIILNASIVIYMLLTAFRFGIILYKSFSKDLDNLQKNITKHREEKKRTEKLQYRIENFLNEFEDAQDKRKNNRMSKIIKNDKQN